MLAILNFKQPTPPGTYFPGAILTFEKWVILSPNHGFHVEPYWRRSYISSRGWEWVPPAPQALPLGISLIKRRNRLWGLREAIFMLGIVEKTVWLSISILLAEKLGTSAFSRRTLSATGSLSFVVLFNIVLTCLGILDGHFHFFSAIRLDKTFILFTETF